MASKKGIKRILHAELIKEEKKLIPAYSKALKKHASENIGWPQNLVDATRIAHDGKTPLIVYKQDVDQQFNDQEYGLPGSPMKSAIRTFIWGRDN